MNNIKHLFTYSNSLYLLTLRTVTGYVGKLSPDIPVDDTTNMNQNKIMIFEILTVTNTMITVF
jgi:hypothetical protein